MIVDHGLSAFWAVHYSCPESPPRVDQLAQADGERAP